jgi:hypothetical protein
VIVFQSASFTMLGPNGATCRRFVLQHGGWDFNARDVRILAQELNEIADKLDDLNKVKK